MLQNKFNLIYEEVQELIIQYQVKVIDANMMGTTIDAQVWYEIETQSNALLGEYVTLHNLYCNKEMSYTELREHSRLVKQCSMQMTVLIELAHTKYLKNGES